jgi:precorrin-8X/cobalt-precorrin-8 methylmutase
MQRSSLVQRYALAPDAIETLSRERLAAHLRLPPDLTPEQAELAARIAYATGDPAIAEAVRVHPRAVEAGVAALRAGRPIVVDVKMARAGIDRRRAGPLGCRVRCAIDDPLVAARAEAEGVPRAVAAMRRLAPEMDGAVVVIGNAPTALLAVLDLVDAGAARPALIIGMPVGFVAAAEAKGELMARPVPWITVEGTRGGTPAAVAAVNTLLRHASTTPAGHPGEHTAVLFLGHGSRRAAAGRAMELILEGVRRRGGFAIVEHGYLEFDARSIPEGVRRCVAQGATRIIAVPYFLHVGMHMVRDLPRVLRAEQAKYPHVPIVLGRHIGPHLDLVDIMLERIAESWHLPPVTEAEITAAYYEGEGLDVADAPQMDDDD